MKKYLLIATVAFGFALTACSGGGQKTETAPATTDAAKPAVTATTDSISANDVLAKYEALVNKVIELKAQGTAASASDLSKLNDDATALKAQLQKVASTLTPEQQQKLADLMQKFTAAFAPAANAPQGAKK